MQDVDAARAKGLQLDDKVELVTADVTKPECVATQIFSTMNFLMFHSIAERLQKISFAKLLNVIPAHRTLAAAIGDAQAVISAIGFKGGADAKGYEAIDNKVYPS